MAKQKTVYFCSECGHESSKWMGQCPACKQWNTFVEEKITAAKKGGAKPVKASASPMSISEVTVQNEERFPTGIHELDRVLGGGIVTGSLSLVGGDPGIGKSTLLLQVCRNLTNQGRKVLYISGEESMHQIKIRAERIGTFEQEMLLFCETDLDAICSAILKTKPQFVVIDSIQTMYSEGRPLFQSHKSRQIHNWSGQQTGCSAVLPTSSAAESVPAAVLPFPLQPLHFPLPSFRLPLPEI